MTSTPSSSTRSRRAPRSTAHDLEALVEATALAALDAQAGVAPNASTPASPAPPARPSTPAAPAAPTTLSALERRLIDAPPPAALVRVWWAGLSAAARHELGERAPLAVGNLDGVPWPARVAANHRTLAAYLRARDDAARTGGPLAPAPASPGDRLIDAVSPRRAARRADRERRYTERLELLDAGPGFVGRGGRPRFLLAFDPVRDAAVEYVGHAIADTDDPFASPFAPGVESVALFVPGNESDLLQFEAKAHTMSELVLTSPPGTTGLVVWQGGSFPAGPGALSSRHAMRLARRFGAFVNAVPRAANVRLVAFGFSFGGGVVGAAMRLGMRVDAVAHIASAGLGPGVRSLADYPASARVPHVSMLAPGDRQVAPFLSLDLPRGPRGIGLGADPSAAAGVTRLETGFERAVPEGGDVDAGRAAGILRGHATLLERWGTTAKHGMRAALTGGRAELAAPRTPLERLGERFGAPWSPLQRADYRPRFTTLPGTAAPGTPTPAATTAPAPAPDLTAPSHPSAAPASSPAPRSARGSSRIDAP